MFFQLVLLMVDVVNGNMVEIEVDDVVFDDAA